MAFSIGEAATTATPEVGREEKQEQLTYSCNINVMHQEMYDETYGVMYVEMYDEMCSTAFNRELRTEYNICKPVYYIQQCDTYPNPCSHYPNPRSHSLRDCLQPADPHLHHRHGAVQGRGRAGGHHHDPPCLLLGRQQVVQWGRAGGHRCDPSDHHLGQVLAADAESVQRGHLRDPDQDQPV